MSIHLSNRKIVGFAVCGIMAAVWAATGAGWSDTNVKAPQPGSLFMTDLFENVRLPSITVTRDGALLAFADGCRLLRRSEDQGKTWSEPTEVNPGGGGNVVVDAQNGEVLI
ncbi:MAG: hypothetical protein ACP5I1_19750, partial [Candidatus Hinthialibacter sp.]